MTDTARSLLEELVKELGPDVPGESGTVPRELERRIRECLRTSSAPDGLDVERLARAYYEVARRRMPTLLPPWRDPTIPVEVWDKSVADGEEIAAEYDRLVRQRG